MRTRRAVWGLAGFLFCLCGVFGSGNLTANSASSAQTTTLTQVNFFYISEGVSLSKNPTSITLTEQKTVFWDIQYSNNPKQGQPGEMSFSPYGMTISGNGVNYWSQAPKGQIILPAGTYTLTVSGGSATYTPTEYPWVPKSVWGNAIGKVFYYYDVDGNVYDINCMSPYFDSIPSYRFNTLTMYLPTAAKTGSITPDDTSINNPDIPLTPLVELIPYSQLWDYDVRVWYTYDWEYHNDDQKPWLKVDRYSRDNILQNEDVNVHPPTSGYFTLKANQYVKISMNNGRRSEMNETLGGFKYRVQFMYKLDDVSPNTPGPVRVNLTQYNGVYYTTIPDVNVNFTTVDDNGVVYKNYEEKSGVSTYHVQVIDRSAGDFEADPSLRENAMYDVFPYDIPRDSSLATPNTDIQTSIHLPSGDRVYYVKLIAIDHAKNRSQSGQEIQIRYLKSKPQTPDSPQAEDLGTPAKTNHSNITWIWKPVTDDCGIGIKEYRVHIEKDGITVGNDWTSVGPAMRYNLNIPDGQDGTYTCRVKAVNLAGIEGNPSDPGTVIVDRTVPEVTFPAYPVRMHGNKATFTWNTIYDSSNIDHYDVAITQTAEPPTQGILNVGTSLCYEFPNINWENSYYAWVRGVDSLGNIGPWIQVGPFPDVSYSPSQDIPYNNLAEQTFTINSLTDKALKAQLNYSASSVSNAHASQSSLSVSPLSVPLSEGIWLCSIDIYDVDAEGNFISQSKQTTPTFQVRVDRTAPSGSLNVKTSDGSQTLDTDEHPTNSLQVRVFTADLADGDTNSSGIKGAYFWNGPSPTMPQDPSAYIFKSLADLQSSSGFLWTLVDGDDGNRTITMQLLDNAGNASAVTYTLKLDRSAPGIPGNFGHTFSQTGDRIQFTWTVDGIQDLTKFAGSYTLPSGTQVAFDNVIPSRQDNYYQGIISIPVAGLGPNLPVSVTVHAVDKAGNCSPDSTAYFAFTKAILGNLQPLPGGYDSSTGQHYLKWRLNSRPGEADGHILEFGIQTDQGFVVQGKLDPDANDIFTLTGLPVHGSCYYRLVALNGSSPADRTEGSVLTRQAANELPTPPVLKAPMAWAGTGFSFNYGDSQDVDGDLLAHQIYIKEQSESQYSVYSSNYIFTHGRTYYWYVVADDGHGGTTSSETVGRFVADFNPPTLNISNPPGLYTNLSQLQMTAADDLSGVAKVTVQKIPGDLVVDELTLTKKNGEVFSEIPLTEGAYSLLITAVDQAGNHTTVNVPNLRIDRIPPVITNIQLDLPRTNGRYLLSQDQVIVHWSATDNDAGVQNFCYQLVAKSGDPITNPNFISLSKNMTGYQYCLQLAGQDGHEYYLAMKVTDQAGNDSAIQYIGPILIDLSKPQLQFELTGFIIDGSGRYVSALSELSSQITCDDLETGATTPEFAVQNDRNSILFSWASWSDLQRVSLQPGRYRVICHAFNGAGLEADTQSPWFFLDNTPPQSLTLSVPLNRMVSGELAVFKASAVENESVIVSYQLAIGSIPGGSDLSSLIPENQSGWIVVDSHQTSQSIRFILPSIANGIYYTTLKVRNAAGLTSTVNGGLFTIDNSQECVMVADQGPYTMFADRLSASWRYNGPRTIKEYQYRIADGNNQSVLDWTTTTGTYVALTGLHLQYGRAYHFSVKAILTDGGEVTGQSPGVIIDTTPPEITSLVTPTYSTSPNLNFAWSGQDDLSGITRIQVALGSDYGQTDITGGWVEESGSVIALSCKSDGTPLNLQTGSRYYLTLRLTNGAGLTVEKIAPAITIDDQAPPIPIVVDQGSFINTIQDLKANWIWSPLDPVSGTTFQWAILDNTCTVTPDTVWHDGDSNMKTALSAAQYPRVDGHTYYFAVKATNGAGLSSIGYSNGIMVDATAPYIPDVTLKQAVNFGQDKKEVTYITNLNNLELWIDSLDPESGIDRYQYAYGPRKSVDNTPETSTPNAINPLTNPQIEEGILTLFKSECYNGADLKSQPGYSVGVVFDTGAPKIVNVHGGITGNLFLFDWLVDFGQDDGTLHSPVAWYDVALVPEEKANNTPATWTNVGLNPFYALDGTNLSDGNYRLLVRACNQAGTYSRRQGTINEWGVSPRITLDRQAPILAPGSFKYPQYAGSSMTVSLTASDNLSGIGGYQYALGDDTDPFKYTYGWVDIDSREGSVELIISTQAVPHGVKVYLMARAKDGVGLWSDPLISQAIIVDHTPPSTPVIACGSFTRIASMISDISYSALDPESGITHYRLGIVRDGSDVLLMVQEGMRSDFNGTISGLNLAEGQIYRLLLQVQNGAGDWSSVGTSAPITMDSTPPTVTFVQGDTPIVLNRPPINISFVLSEAATVEFVLTSLKDGSNKTFRQTSPAGMNTLVFRESDWGTYQLQAIATDTAGNIGIASQQMVRVNTPPLVSLSPMANRTDGGVETTPGAPLVLVAAVSDPDGAPNEVLTYQWEIGVTGEAVLFGTMPTYRYRTLGAYTLKLTVTDPDGGSTTANITVHVGNTSQGLLYQDEVWSGTHHITGDVTAPAGIKLTIMPGTTVLIDDGFGLTINGSLIASGGAQTVFRSPDAGEWQGIDLEGEGTLDGVLIKNAFRGLTVAGSANTTIRNCVFQNNEVGLHILDAKPLVDRCSFLNNTLYGIKEDEGGRPLVTNCFFSGNGNDYYQEDETLIGVDELNRIEGNGGNHE